MQAVTRDGAAILKYKVSNGRLRASMRHLDQATTDSVPVHSFDRVEKLAPGQIVQLDIDMFPVGLLLYPGEQLRFLVTGRNIFGGAMPGTDNVVPENRGRHILHTGGANPCFLQIPMRSPQRTPSR